MKPTRPVLEVYLGDISFLLEQYATGRRVFICLGIYLPVAFYIRNFNRYQKNIDGILGFNYTSFSPQEF